MGNTMKVKTITATIVEGGWKFEFSKPKNVKTLSNTFYEFKAVKNGYSYSFLVEDESEEVALEIFKAFIQVELKKKISELYQNIKNLGVWNV